VFRRQSYVKHTRTAKQPTKAAKHTKTLKSNRRALETTHQYTYTRIHTNAHNKWPPEICTTNTTKYAVEKHTKQNQQHIAAERG